ncbi:hypothetical protein ACS0TY_012098 [Phlomoides rotata]
MVWGVHGARFPSKQPTNVPSPKICEIFGDDSNHEDDHDSQNQATGNNNQEGNNESQNQGNQSNHQENNMESGSQSIAVEEEQTSEIVMGMQFPSPDSLFDTYQELARVRGFSVVKRTSKKASEEDYKYDLMVCDKSGTSKAQNSSKRVDC